MDKNNYANHHSNTKMKKAPLKRSSKTYHHEKLHMNQKS